MFWLIRGEAQLPADPGWLAASEKDRAGRLRYTKRRTEFLLRRLAAKHAVAAVTAMPADPFTLSRIDVRNEPGGAPLVYVDGQLSDVAISLSDRAGWAVCLAGRGVFGCDLEIVEPRSAAFVTEFLTPIEQSSVGRSADPDTAANLVWSAKESALKALRIGLRRHPQQIEVTIVDGGVGGWQPLSVRTWEGSLPGWWRRDGRFLFTVVAAQAGPPPAPLGDPSQVLAAAAPAQSWRSRPVIV